MTDSNERPSSPPPELPKTEMSSLPRIDEEIVSFTEKILSSQPMEFQIDQTEGAPGLRIEDGNVIISEKRLKEAEAVVLANLEQALSTGDPIKLRSYLYYLEDDESAEAEAIREQVRGILLGHTEEQEKTAFDALKVYLPTQTMAQREVVRQTLAGEIGKLPFVFRDAKGAVIPTSSVDIVATIDGNKFKLLVASDRGIAQFALKDGGPGDDDYQPDITSAELDTQSGSLTVPVEESRSHAPALIGNVEVFLGQKVNLNEKLVEEEKKNKPPKTYAPPPTASAPPVQPRPSPPPPPPTPYVSVQSSH